MAAVISKAKLAELKLLSRFVLCTALPGLLFKLRKFGFCKWVCLKYLTDGLGPLPNNVLLILAARTLTPSEDRRIASLYRCAYNLPLSEKFTFVEILTFSILQNLVYTLSLNSETLWLGIPKLHGVTNDIILNLISP